MFYIIATIVLLVAFIVTAFYGVWWYGMLKQQELDRLLENNVTHHGQKS